MAGWTNRGKYNALKALHDGTALPTNYYVALVTSTTAPAADINTMSELTEVSAGNGYTSGGIQLSKNTTDFDVATEDDGSDKAYIQIKDLTWTASGGSIANARYAVLTNDAGTTVGAREVLYYWDLGSDKTISDGDSLTLKDLQIDLLEA
jgi:hypothetical protein